MPPVDTLNPDHLIIKPYSLYFSSSQHLYLSHSKNTKCGVKIRAGNYTSKISKLFSSTWLNPDWIWDLKGPFSNS